MSSDQGHQNEIWSGGTTGYAEQSAVARAYNGGLGAKPPEDEKLFPFAHPAEVANLSYFLFICSILHVQARTDFLARNDVVISCYWHALHVVCLSGTDVHCDIVVK